MIKEVKYPVPFVKNESDRCVPATIGMVLAYFMPEKNFSDADLDKITGYKSGRGTWSTESMIQLAQLGFQTKWIEDFDHEEFSKHPEKYLATILDEASFKWQVEHGDLAIEAARMKEYIGDGHSIEHRTGTSDDIKTLLGDGWLLRLEVNANTLAAKPGYEGHSILVIGYDNENVTIHNPDGANGNRPNQIVSWELLNKAWKEFGGSFSMYAFKK